MLRKVLLPIVGTIIALAPFAVAAPAHAGPMCGMTLYCTRTYYTDVTYTDVVGQEFIGCGGDNSDWGDTSAWSRLWYDGSCE